MIVALLAEKGGVGKTMIACNLAGMRAALGRRVLLLEADRQGGSFAWVESRSGAQKALPRVLCEPRYGPAFARYAVNGMRLDRYDDIVVDLGLGYSVEMDAALESVDLALVPVRPSLVDIRTMGLVNSRVASARQENPDLRACVVLNGVSTNPRSQDAQVTRDIIGASCEALAVTDVELRERVAYRHAYSYGQTVIEYSVGRGRNKAVDEIRALYAETFGEPYPLAQRLRATRNTSEVSR